jgi:MFS family permease
MSASDDSGKGPGLNVAVTASAGAAIEWYDFFIYGTAAALVFPKLFFPADLPPFVAQIAAFSTFAVGFLARPIGGMLFGHFGDTVRAQAGPVDRAPDHGPGDHRRRPVAHLCDGGGAGAADAGGSCVSCRAWPSADSGAGRRCWPSRARRPGRQGFYGSFVQIGVPLGVVLANVVFLVAGVLMPSRAFPGLGLADPVPAQRRPGGDRRLRPCEPARAGRIRGCPGRGGRRRVPSLRR